MVFVVTMYLRWPVAHFQESNGIHVEELPSRINSIKNNLEKVCLSRWTFHLDPIIFQYFSYFKFIQESQNGTLF